MFVVLLEILVALVKLPVLPILTDLARDRHYVLEAKLESIWDSIFHLKFLNDTGFCVGSSSNL